MQPATGEVTFLLERMSEGDSSAEDLLLRCVYLELHRIAARCLSSERSGHTLQATALVNEAYMKLCRQADVDWQNRLHFYAVAARVMRRILTDYARQSNAQKRPGSQNRAEWDEALCVSTEDLGLALMIDEALEKIALMSPRAARVVELRFFVGLTEQEIAALLKVSERTVKRDWLMARAWLHDLLKAS